MMTGESVAIATGTIAYCEAGSYGVAVGNISCRKGRKGRKNITVAVGTIAYCHASSDGVAVGNISCGKGGKNVAIATSSIAYSKASCDGIAVGRRWQRGQGGVAWDGCTQINSSLHCEVIGFK